MGVVLLCGALRFLVWDLGVFFLEREEGRGVEGLGFWSLRVSVTLLRMAGV